MITRVEQGDNPEVPIQSPTLSILFEQGDSIETEIEIVENGVIVTQTSTMVMWLPPCKNTQAKYPIWRRGMVAVHEQMMKAHHAVKQQKPHPMIAQPELRTAPMSVVPKKSTDGTFS